MSTNQTAGNNAPVKTCENCPAANSNDEMAKPPACSGHKLTISNDDVIPMGPESGIEIETH